MISKHSHADILWNGTFQPETITDGKIIYIPLALLHKIRITTYNSPPEGVCVTSDISLQFFLTTTLFLLLCQVHEVGRKDQAKEPDV